MRFSATSANRSPGSPIARTRYNLVISASKVSRPSLPGSAFSSEKKLGSSSSSPCPVSATMARSTAATSAGSLEDRHRAEPPVSDPVRRAEDAVHAPGRLHPLRPAPGQNRLTLAVLVQLARADPLRQPSDHLVLIAAREHPEPQRLTDLRPVPLHAAAHHLEPAHPARIQAELTALDLEALHHQPEAQPRRPVLAGQQLQVGVDQRPRRDQIIQFPLTAHGTTLAERASSTDPPPTQRRYAGRRHRGDDTPHGGRPYAGGYGTRLRSWCASTSTRPATSARSSTSSSAPTTTTSPWPAITAGSSSSTTRPCSGSKPTWKPKAMRSKSMSTGSGPTASTGKTTPKRSTSKNTTTPRRRQQQHDSGAPA